MPTTSFIRDFRCFFLKFLKVIHFTSRRGHALPPKPSLFLDGGLRLLFFLEKQHQIVKAVTSDCFCVGKSELGSNKAHYQLHRQAKEKEEEGLWYPFQNVELSAYSNRKKLKWKL